MKCNHSITKRYTLRYALCPKLKPVPSVYRTWGNTSVDVKTKNCVQMNMFVMDYGSCTGDTFQSICSRPKG